MPSVGQWLEHWLDVIAARKVRPSTLTRYRQLTVNQLLPGIGDHRLDRLQPEHVEQLYGELLARGLAPATVLQGHRVLSRALKVAMQRGKLARNVCTLVDAPSLQRTEVQPLTGMEARRVLSSAAGRRNAARWSVALALGLRLGEALGLAWDAVDLDRGLLTVRQALQRQQGKGLVLVQPKSRAGRRTIALPRQLRDAMQQHRATQAAERLAAGSSWEDHGLVFCQPNGRPLDPRADHRQWQALLADAHVALPGCTTPGTPRRRCCSSSRECQRGWRWRSSATARSASRSARTATSCRRSPRTQQGGCARRCGAEWPPDWHHDAPTSPGRTARSPRSGRMGRQGIEP